MKLKMKYLSLCCGLLGLFVMAWFSSPVHSQSKDPMAILKGLDKNGDNRISREEAPSSMRRDWMSYDSNRDNYVSLAELSAAYNRYKMYQNRLENAQAQNNAEKYEAYDVRLIQVPAKIKSKVRVYVKGTNVGRKQDGKTWESAYSDLQKGINAAYQRGGGEVWVARGTYRPRGDGRLSTYQLLPGVAVYGGFKGDERRRDARDMKRFRTILSGNLDDRSSDHDNAYHVVTGADNAILDGVTIQDGNAYVYTYKKRQPSSHLNHGNGGGSSAAATSTNPTNVMSNAYGSGAGLLNWKCSPTIRNVIFKNNKAFKGAAMYNMSSRTFPPDPDPKKMIPGPLIENCTFENNHSFGRGGAVANDLGTHPTFKNCVFFNNSSTKGGAMYNDFGCSPIVLNCLFYKNTAVQGGAMANDGASSPVIMNCTITANIALDMGAGVYQGTGPQNNPQIINCIIWGNECKYGPADIYNWHDNLPIITDSNVGGGVYPGKGNVDVDPLFVNPEKDNYALQESSPVKQWGHTAKITARIPVPDYNPRPQFDRKLKVMKPKVDKPKQQIVCVNPYSKATKPDGKTFATGYRDLQAAIDHAWASEGEVWVMAGTYKPGDGKDRQASFQLRPGVKVYGGFKGTERTLEERKYMNNPTILSGDIGVVGDPKDNSYHVLIGNDQALLDGFVIRDGYADGQGYDAKGGGVINYVRSTQGPPMGTPTGYSTQFANCLFTENYAIAGGAVYSYDRAVLSFKNCSFVNNKAEYGGAVVDRIGVKSTFNGCSFKGNEGKYRGGALYFDYGARPVIYNCLFEGNKSEIAGGAVYTISRASQLDATIVTISYTKFKGNEAGVSGASICNTDMSTVYIDKATVNYSGDALGKEKILNLYATTVFLSK